ncbi:Lipase-3 domain-containing protein [Mycena sanguinolenta]|uniref:Lipase-3 domain-containing protein n=1 Tax=Mycena sanguinolenta TaxID=230812 RepID=A0A8H7CLW9_9AGAR|nr:Lipase-3 domain-containing protein [Mycena sanguinolenta]
MSDISRGQHLILFPFSPSSTARSFIFPFLCLSVSRTFILLILSSIMLASFVLSFLPLTLAAPLFGLGSSEATGAPTPMSLSTVNTTLLRPALFARAAYCSSASLSSWSCGAPCDSLAGVTFLQDGGNQGTIPLYFIAHDAEDQSLVVAHEGTDPDNILSLLNDAEFALVDVNTTAIPQAAGKGIKVHDGFQSTFERTADGLLAGVQAQLQATGVKKVVVTGHSLGSYFAAGLRNNTGAALATMTGAMIKGAVDPSVDVVVTTFGLPRGGNEAWANFLDSNIGVTFMTNQNDPVPTVPPLLFGYTHSSGEVHIVDSSQTNIVSCPGHDNEHCVTGNSILHASITNHLGPYF